jgi:hypothetical protein
MIYQSLTARLMRKRNANELKRVRPVTREKWKTGLDRGAAKVIKKSFAGRERKTFWAKFLESQDSDRSLKSE